MAKEPTENLTEVQKLEKADAEKAKEYKAPSDVERAFYLAQTTKILAEFPPLGHLASSFNRELNAMELKQEDLDAKEKEEHDKKLADAEAKDAKTAKEKEAKSPLPSQSWQPQDTRSGT